MLSIPWNWDWSWWEGYTVLPSSEKTNLELLSNLALGRTLWKYCRRKNNFMILSLLCCLAYPQDTKIFVNKSWCLCHRAIWNKFKKLRRRYLIHQLYMISSTFYVNVEENGSPKSNTHMFDLELLFAQVDIESLKYNIKLWKPFFSVVLSQVGSKMSYFGNNDLLILQFRPDNNNSKNCSERFRDSKKSIFRFWGSFWLPY